MRDKMIAIITLDLLKKVMDNPPGLEEMGTWTDEMVKEASDWASAEYSYAQGEDVERLEVPAFLGVKSDDE